MFRIRLSLRVFKQYVPIHWPILFIVSIALIRRDRIGCGTRVSGPDEVPSERRIRRRSSPYKHPGPLSFPSLCRVLCGSAEYPPERPSEPAPDGTARCVRDVGGDQCRVGVLMAKILLHCGHIVTRIAQMWKARRPEGVTAHGPEHSGQFKPLPQVASRSPTTGADRPRSHAPLAAGCGSRWAAVAPVP